MAVRGTITDLLEAARRQIDRVEPGEAHRAMIEGNAILVDTRCADDRHAGGRVPGAIEIPLSVLYWRLDPASGYNDPRLSDLSNRIVLMCAHGYSSSLAAATLRDLGFDGATDVVGGFEGWVAAGLPVEAAAE